jgi:hypothetical protein
MYDPKAPRRTFNGEEAWFPLLEDLGHRGLRVALIEAGLTPQLAGGVVWFLDDQRHLDRHQSDKSRNRYRRELDELDPDAIRALARRAIPGLFNSRHAAA